MADPNNIEMIEMWQTGKLSINIYLLPQNEKSYSAFRCGDSSKGQENERWQDIKTILEEKVLKKGSYSIMVESLSLSDTLTSQIHKT